MSNPEKRVGGLLISKLRHQTGCLPSPLGAPSSARFYRDYGGHRANARSHRPTQHKCYPQAVQITLTIPDELGALLIPAGKDPAQAALEALVIERYRAQRLSESESEVRRMLGCGTRMQVRVLLKEHDVSLNYSMADPRTRHPRLR